MTYMIGVAMLLVGVVMVRGSLPAVHWVAERWPRVHDRGSVDLLASSAFVLRFAGLLVALAGVGVILSKVIGG